MKSVRLEEIVDICSSKRIKMSEYVTSGIPFYRSKEIINLHKNQNIQTELFITEERYDEVNLKSGAPIEGDILLTSVGTLGVPYQVKKDDKFYFKDGNLTWFRNFSNDVNKRFFYFWLTSPIAKRKFDEITIGSTQKALTIVSLKGIEIDIPDITEQNKIAEVIGEIQEKIELNQKMNETLEEIAKTLFKSWFIDFNPVRAKAEGRSTGISKEISDLFPDSFEDSELGEIPKGWQITNLDALTSKFTTGLNPRQNFVLGSGENFYVTIKNIGDFEVELDKKCDKVDNDAIKKINSRSDLKKDDILFSGIGTIGKVIYVFDEPKNWNISESVFSLRANPELTFPSFLYQLLKSYHLQGYVDALASGSVQRGIRMGSLKEYKFSLSNYEVQKKFNEIISPLIGKISSNLKETRILISIRDTLLPKLISGELKIPDAESLIDEAGIKCL